MAKGNIVLTGVSVPVSEGSADPPRSGWCDGSGAYEGYRAFMTIETGGGPYSALNVTGFVSNAQGHIIPAGND